MNSSVTIREPRPVLSPDECDEIRARISSATRTIAIGALIVNERGFVHPYVAPVRPERHGIIPGKLRSFAEKLKTKNRLETMHEQQRQEELRRERYARIVAVIPAYEKEDEIDKSVESLLLQSRPVDQIVVVINGPGESNQARKRLDWLVDTFSEQLIVAEPPSLNGRDATMKSRGSKVGALNWAYAEFLVEGDFDFMLGMDADVVADDEMVHHLEVDLLRQARAGGVRARYSFMVPTDTKGKSMSLIYGQRHEFTKKEIDDALHGRAHILGGQATLFDIAALKAAARITNGRVPWSDDTLVEDAELTRSFEKLGYRPNVSATARAWTGLMFTAYAWQKQRRKWQDGHLTDMTKDIHPWADRRRWREQFALGWNLLLRVMFAVVVGTSLALDQFKFNPWWLMPLGVVMVQSLMIAIKTPNRSLREIIRALLYIPGEIYYLRTLSIWLDSVIIVTLNIKRDGWTNQATAESSQKKTAMSAWVLILSAIALPMAALVVLERFIAASIMSDIVMFGWWAIAGMTALSVVSMLWFIVRVLRCWRTLRP